MDRRDEVARVIDESKDVDEAIRRVGQPLGGGALGNQGSALPGARTAG